MEAQEVRKDKTIDAKRNHLNFTLLDISSTYVGSAVFGHFMLSGRYKQSERKKALNQGVNAIHTNTILIYVRCQVAVL